MPSGSCTRPPRTFACLAEVGLRPARLFDTELGGRLLGLPRVGLAAVVEHYLGLRLAKEHSAVDWSTRPLPEPWLRYAALDVEVLVDVRDLWASTSPSQGKVGVGRARSSRPYSLSGATGPDRAVAPHLRHAPHPQPPRRGARARAVAGPRRDRRRSVTCPPVG